MIRFKGMQLSGALAAGLPDVFKSKQRRLDEAVIRTMVPYVPVAQRYTLANGAPLTYAADKDRHLRSITLECTPSQADSLAGAVHHGVLVAAGLPSFSHSQSAEYVAPFLNQYRGQVIHITGACTFTEAMRGVIRVELPVQIEDGDVGVPMVRTPRSRSASFG